MQRRFAAVLAVLILVSSGCSQPEQLSTSHPGGAASRLVQSRIGRGEKFEEVEIQSGQGVLVDEYWAFWVKDGQIFALNGLAKGLAPDLDYGPPGLGSESLREALRPRTDAPQTQSSTSHENPLGQAVHDVLRQRGYLAHGGDVSRSTNVWKRRDSATTVTGQFEGQGNGMFLRRIRSLRLERDGMTVWESNRIRVAGGEIYIDTGTGWRAPDFGP